MDYIELGRTGERVSKLALGSQWIGDDGISDAQAEDVVRIALEAGITLFDTARSYGCSEQRLGRYLAPHRAAVLISTKLGYDMAGCEDWSAACVTQGVEAALQRLNTDYLDIVHLHSCSLNILKKGEAIAALQAAQSSGKIRFIAYSGENDALQWAAQSGVFDVLQCSLNLVDQFSLNTLLPIIHDRRIGLLQKRSIANAVWQYDSMPKRADLQTYWQRWQAFWPEYRQQYRRACGHDVVESFSYEHSLALRFSLQADKNGVVLVGASRPASLLSAVAVAESPWLTPLEQHTIAATYQQVGVMWPGLI